jgi:hypothetical protein
MIPSSSSFSVSELSLSSSSSDSTVNITAAEQGQELSWGSQPSSCFLVLHNPKPAPASPGRAHVGRGACFLLWLLGALA